MPTTKGPAVKDPTISDISIINWNTAEATPVASGLERTLCSEGLCGSKTLTVYQRTVLPGRQLDVNARDDYHLVYVIEAAKAGSISFNGNVACSGGGRRCSARAGRNGAI